MQTKGMRYLEPNTEETLRKERRMAFIAGPRQVGKTTFAKSLLEPASQSSRDSDEFPYFNWDSESARRAILKRPEDFWRPESGSAPSRIVLDEIHKYPRWKRFLKGLFDTQRAKVEIIVTGSGRLDVYQKGGDSLFGRYHLYHLMPYSVGELAGSKVRELSPEACLNRVRDSSASFENDLRAISRFGGFPEPLFGGDDARLVRWQNDHRQLILREDLRDLSQIREIGLIENMIHLLPERVGSPLSVNSLREDLGVNFKTVQNWISVLDRLYYLFTLKPYAGKMARALRREEKAYFYDWSVLEDSSKRLENLVALHLLKACFFWTDAGHGNFELHYVRDKEKRECDFLVVNKRRPFLLVEVKLSEKQIDPSLPYFQEKLKPEHAFQVIGEAPANYLSEKENGLFAVSASRFLGALV